ncbi:MAG: type II secretion system protein N [Nevskia sp.]|nr:type II secretion system protein N [Nevskia sp.]
MKARTLLLIGLLAFLWTLLLNAPAATLYGWFAPKASPLQLWGMDGSLAQGQVQTLGVNGRPLLQNLRWTFQPWWLPLLRASFHVEGGGQDLNLKGRVALVIGGVNISGAQGGGSVKALAATAGFPFVPVDGQARFDLASLKLRKGLPQSVNGTVELHGLAFTLGKEPMPLGDFKATLSDQPPPAGTNGNNSVKAVIETLAGPIDASGEVHLQADRSYDYDLQVKARDNADPNLRNLLQGGGLGQPDTRGYYHLRNRGSF